MDITSSIAGGEESVRPSQALSVITPSVARFSRATSTDFHNFHMSNPNPQPRKQRYYGARDTLSKADGPIPVEKEHADLIKFGKRVNFGSMPNNEDLL